MSNQVKPRNKESQDAGLDSMNEERLLDAAVRCIEQYGVAKTFLDDIAREANLSRRTVYRTFASRRALLERVALKAIAQMVGKAQAKLRKLSITDAFTRGAVETLSIAKQDKVFMAVLEALGDEGFERYLLNPKGPAFTFTQAAWEETYARARAAGELGLDVTDQELTMLLSSANCIFLLRDEMTKQEQINFMEKFFLKTIR